MKFLLILTFCLLSTFSKVTAQTKKDSLYVFVGEKIYVKYAPEEIKKKPLQKLIIGKDTSWVQPVTIQFDGRYIARYKILQWVYNSLKVDTIEFVAYDHYGIPAFSKFKNILLYVSKYKGTYYHEKYQFTDVYKTKNGRWASSYQAEDYEHSFNISSTVKPEKIDFIDEVSYNLGKKDAPQWTSTPPFPSPYYKIQGDKAIAVWGNYVNELFELKKNGVLKARGIFGYCPHSL